MVVGYSWTYPRTYGPHVVLQFQRLLRQEASEVIPGFATLLNFEPSKMSGALLLGTYWVIKTHHGNTLTRHCTGIAGFFIAHVWRGLRCRVHGLSFPLFPWHEHLTGPTKIWASIGYSCGWWHRPLLVDWQGGHPLPDFPSFVETTALRDVVESLIKQWN